MKFRKNSLLFYQSEIIFIGMGLVSLALIPVLGLTISLLWMLFFLILALVNPKLHNEFIVIDDSGIRCQKRGVEMWAYRWESIAELRRTSRFLLPSVDVIVFGPGGEAEPFAKENRYFQIGKAARNTVKQYRNLVKNISDYL